MRRGVTIVCSLALATRAAAQNPSPSPAPQTIECDECVDGDRLLDALGNAGDVLRRYAPQLVERWVPLRIDSEPTAEQADKLAQDVQDPELRRPLLMLRSATDDEILHISYALCRSPDADCARYLAAALRSARYSAQHDLHQRSSLPPNDPQPFGLPHTCDPYVGHVKSPKAGFGAEYATGWQHSANPVDGRAWSFGFEARARLRDTIGFVARVDRSTGRDASHDEDGDGRDDVETGDVTRWTTLVGPTLRLSTHRARDTGRYWQVDSLVGLSRDASRSGIVTALDVSYQLVVARLGVRVMQGFGDARDESSILVHSGLQFGAGPQYDYGAGCGRDERPRGSAWALAFDIPLSGVTSAGDYITPGFGVEGAYHFHEYVDGLVHGDVLALPHGDRERALHQTVLVGARADAHGKGSDRNMFGTLAVGYDYVATTSSDPIQSGPVVEASIGYGLQQSDGAAWLRVHGRFGVSPDNSDLRAYFLSFGTELRLDRSRWRDRN